MEYRELIAQLVKIEGVEPAVVEECIVPTADSKNGDYCLPCFRFAKALHKSPMAIADDLAARIDVNNVQWLQGVEAVNGYLNFRIDRTYYVSHTLPDFVARADDWHGRESNGKTICIDYSSINIAKPFHIGHLLTTVIGGSLHRIFQFLGYKVVGINHLGDWGTQFGKLIVAYRKWGEDKEQTMRSLVDLYVRFHKEAEQDPSLNEEGRYWFRKIEEGDAYALDVFNKFKEITLKEVSKVYDTLGIKFDSYAGESFYNDKMQPVIDELRNKNLLVESEGAQVVMLDEYNMPPCLIVKSDGATLYATRDLAAATYRKRTYDFDKNLYVVAYQQNLHFKQLFKVLELMGYEWAKDCVHVPFGMVSLEGLGSLSTRSGNVVYLSDVLDTAVAKTLDIIQSKSPDLERKQEVAQQIGVGAVVFYALSSGRIKDVVFSYDKALNFDGETGPYLQYTHARCASVIAKAADVSGQVDYSLLTDDESFELVKLLAKFDNVVDNAARDYEPSILSRYLIDLAEAYNKFYISHRIMGEQPNVTVTRRELTRAVRQVLRGGMALILLEAPDKM